MNRIHELVATITTTYPQDRFFSGFEESCRTNPAKKAAYRTYDDALRVLDDLSWQVLKGKAVRHFRDHRPGQLKQGFFNQLNEAFAYRYLVRRGCTQVEMLPEPGIPIPNIRYLDAGTLRHCEVKTLGLSEEEIGRRGSGKTFTNVYIELGEGFFRKLASTIKAAKAQVETQGTGGLVYLVATFDDMALDNYLHYRRQVMSFCRANDLADVYIKVGLRGNRHMRITSACTRRPLRVSTQLARRSATEENNESRRFRSHCGIVEAVSTRRPTGL